MESDSKNPNSSRGKGRGRGRGRKKAAENEIKTQEPSVPTIDERSLEPEALTLDLDADITQLEAPTFSTINKGPPEPMLRLNWDHKTHLIGEKVINPFIHCCDKCGAPILIYGRMIPCKHVFCFTCAERESKCCPRCQEKVIRVEKTGLGTVFMCTFGGTRYGNTGCRRTYLSQRDLQAHINHRHVTGTNTNKDTPNTSQSSLNMKPISASSIRTKSSTSYHATPVAGDPRVHSGNSGEYFHKVHQSPSSHTSSSSQQSRQSHHHGNVSHQSEQSPNPISGMQHQHFSPIQANSAQRHLPVASAQQLLQTSADFMNHMLVSNFMQPNSANLTPPPANLIIQTHADPNTTPNFHQTFSPQFSQTSSPGIPPFPVPPPVQPPMSTMPQNPYFPTPLNAYPNGPSPQRAPVPSFSPNSPAQPMMVQPPPMIPTSSSTPRPVMPPFPVPPPHSWPPQPPPSNPTHFY